jgi:hypothetical protein
VHLVAQILNMLAVCSYMSQFTERFFGINIGDNPVDQFLHDVNLDLLTGVKTLLVEELNKDDEDTEDLDQDTEIVQRELQTWTQRRRTSGNPLASILFRGCSELLCPYFEDLRDSQTALEVSWKEDV